MIMPAGKSNFSLRGWTYAKIDRDHRKNNHNHILRMGVNADLRPFA